MLGPGPSSPATPDPHLGTAQNRMLEVAPCLGGHRNCSGCTSLCAQENMHVTIWTHESWKHLSFVPFPAHTWVPRHPVSLFSQPLGMRMGFAHP